MANLAVPTPGTETFSADVYRIETADPVLGFDGSTNNIANLQAARLIENDLYLKNQIEGIQDGSLLEDDSVSRANLVRGVLPLSVPRNTVINGPYTDGLRSLITSSGTTLSVAACKLAFAAGYDAKGQVDYFGSVSSTTTVSGATPTTGIYYVYAEMGSTGTITIKRTNLAPVISHIEPDSPVSGQLWYDSVAEAFFSYNTGTSAWDSKLIVLLGTANRVIDGSWNNIVTHEYRRDTNFESSIAAGTMSPYAGASAPFGWKFCDGTEYQIDDAPRLFAAIGYTYGGSDGVFQVPDLRGRVIAGQDDMGGSAAGRMTTAGSGLDGATLGANGGAQNVSLTTSQIPPHTHPIATRTGVDLASGGSDNVATNTSPGSTMTSASAGGTAGVVVAHNNVQPTLITNYIIKA